jgi:hypothetical protein
MAGCHPRGGVKKTGFILDQGIFSANDLYSIMEYNRLTKNEIDDTLV